MQNKQHPAPRILAGTAAALMLSSCVIKDGSLDFTWWKDSAAPVIEDDVIIETGHSRSYETAPAPTQIPPAAPQAPQAAPTEPEPEPAPVPPPAPEPRITSQNQQQSTTPPAESTPRVHVVRRGDTLTALARRYGTTVRELVKTNGMTSANEPLQISRLLVIPGRVAKQQPARKTPARPATAGTPGTYTVQTGDTLYGIARRLGVNPARLMQANGFTPETANTIYVGQKLTIPTPN